MSCYARLEKSLEAEAAAIRTREFYATHLGLSDDQRARFVKNGHMIDDLQPIGDRDLQQNPWLYLVLGHAYGPSLPNAFRGETEAERLKVAVGTWRNFFKNRTPIRSAGAYMMFANCQFHEAAKQLESLILISRGYEEISPLRIELLWPRTLLGECYWACGQKAKAVHAWQSARSLEFCQILHPNVDDWGRFGIPWIEKAKSRLAENGIPVPLTEISLKASKHLEQAVGYLLDAEQHEEGSRDLEEVSAQIQKAGRKYTIALNSAAAELQAVERFDLFTWAKCPIRDSSCWYRYESAKGYLFHKLALLHLSQENFALAIANFKQATEVWPMMSWCAALGAVQVACGLTSDAITSYGKCIEQEEELSAFESSDNCRRILKDVQQAIHELR